MPVARRFAAAPLAGGTGVLAYAGLPAGRGLGVLGRRRTA